MTARYPVKCPVCGMGMTAASRHYLEALLALGGDPDSAPPSEKLRVLVTVCCPGLREHEAALRSAVERLVLGNRGRMKVITVRHLRRLVPQRTAAFLDSHRAAALRYALYYAQTLDGYRAVLEPAGGGKPRRVVVTR